MTTTGRLLRSPAVPLALIIVALATWGAFQVFASTAPGTATSARPYFVDAVETVHSSSAVDWASAADVVVDATVVSEHRLASPVSETEVGTGRRVVGRSVTVKVSEVLWRSPTWSMHDPTTITMNAFGWMRDVDGTMREMAVDGGSRLEVGHSYVLALVWEPAECTDGDRTAAAWTWIGSQGIVPADGDVVGSGEVEGSVQSVAETTSEAEGDSLVKANAGAAPTALTDDLQRADDTARRTWPATDHACARQPAS